MKTLIKLIIAQFLSIQLLLAAPVVTLTWQDNANNELGFKIERAEGTNAFLPLIPVPADTVTYEDETVVNGRTYSYRVSAYNTGGDSAWSNTATVSVGTTVAPPAAPGTLQVTQSGLLANVSARGQVTGTDTTLIPGFVVQGGPRRALIRLVGPTIGAAPFNVPGVCADPVLSVRNSSGVEIATNDNWSGQALVDAAASVSAFALPVGSKDAAIIVTLQPGNYTVVARGVGTATGVALAEVYALD